jgi:hypothetical protein
MKKFIIIPLLIIAFIITGCGKKQETAEKTAQQTEEKSLEQQKKDDSIKAAAEQMNKEAKVQEALEEDKIVNDTLGQWAIEAEASSTYGDHTGKDTWSAEQMLGKPDVENYGDDGRAWTTKDPDKGLEWVKLTYPKSVYATEVRVRQTYNPGAIIKVELIDDKGKNHTVWEGVDKTQYAKDKMQYFISKFDKTDYKTKIVKITLATNSVPGWNEIDAVQLIGE